MEQVLRIRVVRQHFIQIRTRPGPYELKRVWLLFLLHIYLELGVVRTLLGL